MRKENQKRKQKHMCVCARARTCVVCPVNKFSGMTADFEQSVWEHPIWVSADKSRSNNKREEGKGTVLEAGFEKEIQVQAKEITKLPGSYSLITLEQHRAVN